MAGQLARPMTADEHIVVAARYTCASPGRGVNRVYRHVLDRGPTRG
jgi:hypothetical protein